ncbi:thioredoxin domain-containing protein 12 isoform X2 [Procambarus clarkii]|uniref:thioredoxin domain-containing protein 12 isoform X2 n=1 Tax=Procambarus clarkii TaxID=6728 RepID=UPI001E674B6F|nr:thioredoxin domain-containing protein 12-like isoform X2 [Procambarus clarkii]
MAFLKSSISFSACFLCGVIGIHVRAENDLGLGEKYDWHTLEDGIKVSKETGKPLMLIIHKSWCGACKAFKPKFAASEDALVLSKKFVMVNTIDDEEPKEEKYSPDGGYIPRILFLDSHGEVQHNIYNKNGNPKYKFYYFDDMTVVESMKEAIEVLKSLPAKGNEL